MSTVSSSVSQPAALITDFEVRTFDNLSDVAAQSHSFCREDGHRGLFTTVAWFQNLAVRGLEPNFDRLWVVVTHVRNGTSVCLPLLKKSSATAAVFGPVVTSLSNYYSSLYGPIGEDHHLSVPALRAAIAHLRRHHRPCTVIDLQPLDTDGCFYTMMQAALQAEGYWIDRYFCFGNWHLKVDDRSYASYEPSIPSRLRNTIKRGRKKLDAAGAWTLEVHTTIGPGLDQAIADFGAIYAQSWKVPEPFPGFVPGLCRMAAEHGWLRLGVLRFEGRPIAAQIWLLKDRHALIYKLAYDEEYKRFSAGSVLSAEMMRQAIDDEGVVDVDYLTGDDGYKVDWMSHRRERQGLVAFDPRSWQGLVSAAKHYAGRAWARRRSASPVHAPAAAESEG